MEQKKRLLYKAVSLIRTRVELSPLKYIEFLPISETSELLGRRVATDEPQGVLLMDSAMFASLKNFVKGATVLVVPTGKETVSLDEIEIYEI